MIAWLRLRVPARSRRTAGQRPALHRFTRFGRLSCGFRRLVSRSGNAARAAVGTTRRRAPDEVGSLREGRTLPNREVAAGGLDRCPTRRGEALLGWIPAAILNSTRHDRVAPRPGAGGSSILVARSNTRTTGLLLAETLAADLAL